MVGIIHGGRDQGRGHARRAEGEDGRGGPRGVLRQDRRPGGRAMSWRHHQARSTRRSSGTRCATGGRWSRRSSSRRFVMPLLVLVVGKVTVGDRLQGARGDPEDHGGRRRRLARDPGASSRRREGSGSSRPPPTGRRSSPNKRVRAAVEIPAGFERALEAGSAPAVTLYDLPGGAQVGHGRRTSLTQLLHGAARAGRRRGCWPTAACRPRWPGRSR